MSPERERIMGDKRLRFKTNISLERVKKYEQFNDAHYCEKIMGGGFYQNKEWKKVSLKSSVSLKLWYANVITSSIIE